MTFFRASARIGVGRVDGVEYVRRRRRVGCRRVLDRSVARFVGAVLLGDSVVVIGTHDAPEFVAERVVMVVEYLKVALDTLYFLPNAGHDTVIVAFGHVGAPCEYFLLAFCE
jgi:hypothetical protein